jgi:hypothetical protein
MSVFTSSEARLAELRLLDEEGQGLPSSLVMRTRQLKMAREILLRACKEKRHECT